jgi:hypothetical protein
MFCCYLFEEDSFCCFTHLKLFSLSGLEFVLLRSNTSMTLVSIKSLNPISLIMEVKLFGKILKPVEECVRYSFYQINDGIG